MIDTTEKTKPPVPAEGFENNRKETESTLGILGAPCYLSNADFLQAIFPDLAADESCWTTSFQASPDSEGALWGGKATNPAKCADTPALNAYFSVAALKPINGERMRRKTHFSRLFCVVLDDSNGCDLVPSWQLATSAGKVQTGYRLSVPEPDVGVAERLHKALSDSKLIAADKNGNNPVRYVRLPVGSNTKHSPAHRCQLIAWNPHVAYTLDEIIEALGFDVAAVRYGAKNAPAPLAGQFDDDEHLDDSELIRLVMSAESYHDPLLKLSARMAARGMKEGEIVTHIEGIMLAANDGSERWQSRFNDIPRMVREGCKKFGRQDDPLADALLHHPTQDNVALVFTRRHAGGLLYAHSFGCWFEWDGMRWRREITDKAFDFARELARKVNREGKASISSASFCNGVEAFARADRAFAVVGTEFDTDNYLLNTPAGTFDLRTNTLRPHNPDDRITHCTAVAPSPEGGARFRQFLQEVTGGDDELASFIKVSLGACLSGAIESHWLLFWTGAGRNGKNTLGDLVMFVMGDYARKIPAATLMAKGRDEHPTELASLKGVRLASSSEVSDGDHWHEARINELTGDTEISARYMRGDFFEFRRTHKHLIYGNHRPQLRSVTPAIKARIKIVPFGQCFIGREDPLLPERLRQEAPYVLNWLIEGHAEWVRLGRKLPDCQAVARESESYFAEQSTVDMWIAERLQVIDPDNRPAYQCPKSSELYRDYSIWKKERGEVPVSQTRWADSMRRFARIQSNGVRYRGAGLRGDFDDDISDLL